MDREPRAEPPRSPRRGRGALQRAFTLAVTLLAIWFLWRTLRDVGFQQLGSRLRAASPGLVLIALALMGARFLTIAARWEILTRREAPVGLRRIAGVLMAGHFVSLVTPVMRIAGPILRAFYLSRETGLPRARFYGTIVADQTANFTAFAAAMACSGVLVALPEPWSVSPATGVGMLAALVGGLWVGWRSLRDVHLGRSSGLTRALETILGRGDEGTWRRRVVDWWDHLVRALSASLIGSGAWWPALTLSVLSFILLTAVQVVSWAAVGTPVGFVEGMFAVAGAGFIQILSAAPGGPGLTEASLILVALAIGLDKESAVAGVFLARAANYVVILAWGGGSFFRLQRRYGVPRPDPRRSTV